MISYSTEFPIKNTNSVAVVLQLACRWLTGSPHTNIPSNVFPVIPVDSENQISLGNETVTIASVSLGDFEIGGLRYVRVEDKGLEWTTSIVTTKTPSQHLLSIQVQCEALNTATRLPAPKKPHFIRQALHELGGGMDGEIPVADCPFFLDEGEVGVAKELILGTAKNRLPIVYVSANYDGTYIVDPNELAEWVSGLAHVIVEPSRNFSIRLKRLTDSRNAYGGTVGVYWPESEARKSYYLDEEHGKARQVQAEIAKDIRVALSNRRQKTNCNWLHLKELISKRHYEKLKSEGSTELKEFIDAFDADQVAKEARMAEAEQEIARLNAELRRLTAISQTANGDLVRAGKEQNLYANEIQDVVIDALEMALRNTHEDSRRQHIIQDLLEHNKPSGTRGVIEDEIKSLLKSYVSMDAKTRAALEKLGFELSDDGKHFKAVFQGDGRYTFSISKTGSDHRAGKNLVSDINKKLF